MFSLLHCAIKLAAHARDLWSHTRGHVLVLIFVHRHLALRERHVRALCAHQRPDRRVCLIAIQERAEEEPCAILHHKLDRTVREEGEEGASDG
jgi:hypothetical protein